MQLGHRHLDPWTIVMSLFPCSGARSTFWQQLHYSPIVVDINSRKIRFFNGINHSVSGAYPGQATLLLLQPPTIYQVINLQYRSCNDIS